MHDGCLTKFMFVQYPAQFSRLKPMLSFLMTRISIQTVINSYKESQNYSQTHEKFLFTLQTDTCNGTCTIWERCIEDDDSTMANIGNTFPVCVLTNGKFEPVALSWLFLLLLLNVWTNWAPSSEFVSSNIPSWQILTAHAQPFRGARDLAFCLKVPLGSLLVRASGGGSGETARMRRLAWTFAARIGEKTKFAWCGPIQPYLPRRLFHHYDWKSLFQVKWVSGVLGSMVILFFHGNSCMQIVQTQMSPTCGVWSGSALFA